MRKASTLALVRQCAKRIAARYQSAHERTGDRRSSAFDPCAPDQPAPSDPTRHPALHAHGNGAAAEGCRVLATASSLEENTETVEGFIKRRLASVPQQENFHVHDPACSWQIDLSGNEASEEVTVSISTEVKPLPLFDFGLDALGVLNSNGNYELKVSHHLTTKSTWVRENTISNEPERWIERWNDS